MTLTLTRIDLELAYEQYKALAYGEWINSRVDIVVPRSGLATIQKHINLFHPESYYIIVPDGVGYIPQPFVFIVGQYGGIFYTREEPISYGRDSGSSIS
jgi:hypothetical protein